MSVILFRKDKVIHLIEREKHLPQGMVQQVYIDLRGQAYTDRDILDIKTRIVDKSNGFIKLENIKFIEDKK